MTDLEFIQKYITESARLEQMAEECVELAHALLKKARRIRGENYTPITESECDYDILEEFTDVMVCAEVLGLKADNNIFEEKINRWAVRNTDLQYFQELE